MSQDVIATDHPLSATQQRTLTALLDSLLPASEDGTMPSAGDLDFVGYLQEHGVEFLPQLAPVLDYFADNFEDEFADLSPADRHPLVETFSQDQAELFGGLLHYAYCCYYQDDRVLVGIGSAAGPPFPRGNTIEAGDLSLLDPVIEASQTYRKPPTGA